MTTGTGTAQRPLGSGFGARTTAAEVMAGQDVRGRTAVVTGGYSGLGLESVRVLAAAGARVLVPVRDPEKARQALQGLPGVEQHPMDLADPASVDAFAERVVSSGRPVQLLLEAAGIMAAPLARDARGHESHFAVNHLGHFQLAVRLWDALTAEGARVVSLSSLGHRFSPVHFDDIDYAHRPYDKWQAYGQSKTATSLFAVGLDARGREHGVRAFAVHPGTIRTDLARHLTEEELEAAGVQRDESGAYHEPQHYKSVAQGAATQVWCAVSPQLEGKGGVYCEDCDISVVIPADSQEDHGVHEWAIDPDDAERLWQVSEGMTGVRLP